MFASAGARRFNFSSSSSQQGASDRRAVIHGPAASAAPASSSDDRPFIDLARARVKTLSFLPKLEVHYATVIHLPPPASRPPTLVIAATILHRNSEFDDVVLRRDLFSHHPAEDQYLRGWNQPCPRAIPTEKDPLGLLMDKKNSALLIGGWGRIWIQRGKEVTGEGGGREEDAEVKPQLSVGTLRQPGDAALLECSLDELQLESVYELLDAKSGDGGFLIVERIQDNSETAIRLVQGDVFSNPRVVTIFQSGVFECEAFTPLTGDRLIVQIGKNNRWTNEVVIDYSKLKQLGRSITTEDIRSVWEERRPLKFKNGVKVDSNAIVQVREHELVIAEKTRLHYASFEVTADGMQTTVHRTIGNPTGSCNLLLDGAASDSGFLELTHVVPIAPGALLVVDCGESTRPWRRLVYDGSYVHSGFVDRWTASPHVLSRMVDVNLRIRRSQPYTPMRSALATAAQRPTRGDEPRTPPPAAAASASAPSSSQRRKRSRPLTPETAREEERQQEAGVDEQAEDTSGRVMMEDSPISAVPPSRPSVKKQRVDEAAASSSSGGVAHSRPINGGDEDVQMAAAEDPMPALSPDISWLTGGPAASSSSVPRSMHSPPPSTTVTAPAAAVSTPAPARSAALAAPASSILASEFQQSRSIIDAEEWEDGRTRVETDCSFARRAVIRAHTRGVITAKDKAARVIEEAQRELEETIAQLDEVRERALQEVDARCQSQLRAIDAELELELEL
jgi:hypothetical protein